MEIILVILLFGILIGVIIWQKKLKSKIDDSYFENAYGEATQMIAIVNIDGEIISANKSLCEFAGLEEKEILGDEYLNLPWFKGSEIMQNKLIFSMEKAYRGELVRFEVGYNRPDGELYEIDFQVRPIKNEEDDIKYFIMMGYNITDLARTKNALTKKEQQLNSLFNYAKDGYFFYLLDEGVPFDKFGRDDAEELLKYHKLVRWNNMLLKQLQCREYDFEKKSLEEIFSVRKDKVVEIFATVIEKGFVDEVFHFNPEDDREERYLDVSIIAMHGTNDDYLGCFSVVHDITKSKIYEKELERYANKDPLTNLNNRRSFFRYSKIQDEKSRKGVLIMLDIDHFKKVNDRYGHDGGDLVLKEVANQLQKHFGELGMVCRYGGEEFAVALWDVGLSKAEEICENFRKAIASSSYDHEDNKIRITISLGLSEIDASVGVEKTIPRADSALYKSKETGRNKLTIFRD